MNSLPSKFANLKQSRGFTLLEMLIVVLIIGLIVSIVVYNVAREPDKARVQTVKSQISQFSSALQAYKLENGHYPSTEQGLEALFNEPSGFPAPDNWGPEPYMVGKEVPVDPWGNEYVYTNDGRNFLIVSYGSDGEPGGGGNVDEDGKDYDYDMDIRSDEI